MGKFVATKGWKWYFCRDVACHVSTVGKCRISMAESHIALAQGNALCKRAFLLTQKG
jgi:hypothetical protein